MDIILGIRKILLIPPFEQDLKIRSAFVVTICLSDKLTHYWRLYVKFDSFLPRNCKWFIESKNKENKLALKFCSFYVP